MALLSFTPEVMKPTALALNIIVASVTTVRFAMAGHFSWRLFWPFALASVPMAYLGGGLPVHTTIYKILVGIALVFAALHLMFRSRVAPDDAERAVLPGHGRIAGNGRGHRVSFRPHGGRRRHFSQSGPDHSAVGGAPENCGRGCGIHPAELDLRSGRISSEGRRVP